jgi:pentatricopeptide repeat protein
MGREAIEVFNRVPLSLLDEWIYVCVLNACSHSGLIDDARKIFHKIPIERRTDKVYTTFVNASRFH